MSLVNHALPPDALPDPRLWPYRDARHILGYSGLLNASAALLDSNLRVGRANRPAIIHRDRTWTYGFLAERVNRLSNALAANGVKPGDRVLVHLPNIPEFIETWLAALRIGAVVVATMPMLKRRELHHILAECEPSSVVTSGDLYPLFDACAPVPRLCILVGQNDLGESAYERFLTAGSGSCEPAPTSVDDVAIVAYTSGTTGTLKGTIHTHGDLLAIADTYAQEVLAPEPKDRFAGHSSLAFTYGLGGLLIFPLRFGASVLLESAPFDAAEWLKLVRRECPTILFSTPTACRLLMEEAPCRERITWRSVRLAVSAGQKLPRDTFLRWQETTGVQILDGCGSTEMLHIWMSQRVGEAIGDCTGRPVGLYEARLLADSGAEIQEREAEGIIALRGPTGCRYWRRPDLQEEIVRDGWTLPGDRFRRDAEGRYWHISRTDDLIVSGGYKIAPAEVEGVLMQHPAVLDAAVVGVSGKMRGERIRAILVLRKGLTRQVEMVGQIRQFVKGEIAEYKCPHEIIVSDSLPRTVTGKLDRLSLAHLEETAPD
ncbi:MAG: AMP-binding protein [Candidatus Methylomirabilis oxygeniifera]|uniref:AMP-dependent synthetase and ligase n=1 Tax=Methylomirabilis oxygeniifera TaxID=671143 RepID=D5MH50_METO1|nr:MAG: AMP-binding protein [Candidatus Methylomirabilis oxyfera]CBE69081.1 AMP-dependent synthetase and ligase [Candidatus Methylomirabilis oxyfera]